MSPARGCQTPTPASPVTSEPPTLEQEISAALNRHSAENGSNTPDYVLARYLLNCLEAFDEAVYGREKHQPFGANHVPPTTSTPAIPCGEDLARSREREIL